MRELQHLHTIYELETFSQSATSMFSGERSKILQELLSKDGKCYLKRTSDLEQSRRNYYLGNLLHNSFLSFAYGIFNDQIPFCLLIFYMPSTPSPLSLVCVWGGGEGRGEGTTTLRPKS